jgi:hypothetical protein
MNEGGSAEVPDEPTARSHKRECEACAQQMKPEAEDEDDDQYADEPDDQN